MGLFDSQSQTDSFVWMAEAIEAGTVKKGDFLDVAQIQKTANGSGFIIRCDLPDGDAVYDYAFRKSASGKVLQAIFDDPTKADNYRITCKVQNSVKCAVCDSQEEKGVTWVLGEESDRETLTPTRKKSVKFRTSEPTANA